MRILEIESRNQDEFLISCVCEHCGHITYEIRRYDDRKFHKGVSPNMICPKCGKNATGEQKAKTPRYPDRLQA